jgi:O-antigen/teichoic acid export membrane protein
MPRRSVTRSGNAVGEPDRPPPPGGLARAISWAGVGHLGSSVTWYASLVVVAALVPPEAFGTVAAGMVMVHLGSLLIEAGGRGTIVTARELDAAHLRRTLAVNVVVGIALTAALAFAARPIVDVVAEGGDAGALRLLFGSLALAAVAVVPLGVLQKRMQFRRLAGISVGSSLVGSAAAIGAAVLGAGVWALVVRQLAWRAVFAVFCWVAAREFLPARERSADERAAGGRRLGATWFTVLAASTFLVLSGDNVIVGQATDAEQLGLYALAFTLGFAPLTQFSWIVGQVLFPAAAALPDLESVGAQMLKAVRLTALVLLPLLPPAVALAPVAIPRLLGREWAAMAAPFAILVVVGVGHALLNILGESLSGTGNIAFRARIELAWALATLAAVFVLVRADGIRGAAVAHLGLFVPLAGVYVVWGTRRVGTDAPRLWRAVRGVVVPVTAEALVTAAAFAALTRVGLDRDAAAVTATMAGIVVVLVLLMRAEPSPLREAATVFAAATRRSA